MIVFKPGVVNKGACSGMQGVRWTWVEGGYWNIPDNSHMECSVLSCPSIEFCNSAFDFERVGGQGWGIRVSTRSGLINNFFQEDSKSDMCMCKLCLKKGEGDGIIEAISIPFGVQELCMLCVVGRRCGGEGVS